MVWGRNLSSRSAVGLSTTDNVWYFHFPSPSVWSADVFCVRQNAVNLSAGCNDTPGYTTGLNISLLFNPLTNLQILMDESVPSVNGTHTSKV